VEEAIAISKKCAIKEMVLTHLSHDHNLVANQSYLPSDIILAHDGMALHI
jgi:ribonuclease BN (tRNA processing enzyme)